MHRFAGRAMPFIALTLLSASFAASAQTSDEDRVTSRATAEEIVVTARKREESLQEVPLSVTAFSAERLQEVGAVNNEDVALLTPNFNTVRQIGRRLDRPTIRGQSAAAVGGEPNASYFIDGVAVAGSISTLTLGPIERVEILRGPQSAQFGRATFAGAVNYVTRKPADELTGEIKGKYGTQDTRQIAGWVSGPVIPGKLNYFVSGGWDQYGGEWRNSIKANQAPVGGFITPDPSRYDEERYPQLATSPPQGDDNTRLGGTETKDVVLKLQFTPNDTSEFSFKFGYTEGDDDHYVQLLQEPGELNCFLPTAANSDEPWFTTSKGQYCGKLDPDNVRYATGNPFSPYDPAFDYAGYFPSGIVNGVNALADGLPREGGARQARLNIADIRTGMAFTDFSQFPPGFQEGFIGRITESADWLATPEEPGTRRKQKRFLFEYVQDIGEWTSTARVALNDDEFDQGLDLDRTEQRYLGGLFTNYVEDETKDYALEWRVDSPAEERLRGSLGVYYFDSENENRQKRYVGIAGFGQLEKDPLLRTVENKAAFGFLEYDISDEWTISGELRWAKDTKEISAPFSCDDEDDPNFGRTADDKQTTDVLTPRLTIRWQPTDDLTLYALAAKGNKPAEFESSYFRQANGDGCETAEAIDSGITQIKEEKAWTYEAGGKKTWLDGRLLTNISAFYIDWTNQSVFETTTINGVLTQVTRNAGKSEVFGIELETSYVFTDNLTGRFSYGLADGKYVEYNQPEYAETTGIGLVYDDNGQPLRIDPNPDNDNDSERVLVYDQSANNVKGNRLPSSPKHSFIFALDYINQTTLNLVGSDTVVDWFARTDFILETDRYSSATNFVKFPNRKMWNFRAGLGQESWTLTGYVTNILDDQTPTAIFGFEVIGGIAWQNGYDTDSNLPDGSTGRFPNMNSVAPTPGRMYGVELLYRFGN